MERKKLNVDEIIYDLKIFSNLEIEEAKKQGAEKAVLLATLTLELIQTLQAEKEELKNEYVKLDIECQKLKTENDELKSPKFASWKIKFFKVQEEIERLTEELETKKKECREIADDYQEMGTLYYNETVKSTELQKQVDELKERAKIDLKNERNWSKIQIKQAVKDTAKEILQELWDETEPTENDEWVRVKIQEIAKRKGVEVE